MTTTYHLANKQTGELLATLAHGAKGVPNTYASEYDAKAAQAALPYGNAYRVKASDEPSVSDLLAQRDALLAACEEALGYIGTGGQQAGLVFAANVLRSAIAAAKGQ